MRKNNYTENFIITLSIAMLFCSAYLFISNELAKTTSVEKLSFEFINTKNISIAKIAYKDGSKKITDTVKSSTEATKQPQTSPTVQQVASTPQVKWQLPTRTGRISSYENYGHVALDITSPRGVYETIYPVAPGTVTSIYYDSAGAKIVTVHHHINGGDYTSQYVHLSSFANGLYVGQYVTPETPLGQMGATGIATGVHLHITVADCILFNPSDPNCKDLNSFFRYIKVRYNQGFKGLRSLTYVPNSW